MFYIICVVYNKTIMDIRSIESFLELRNHHEDVRIRVYDNSEINVAAKNKTYCETVGELIQYVCNDGNIGLSCSYNKMLDTSDETDWLMWTDDDTWFSPAYLENAYHKAKNGQSMIISGVVRTQTDAIISPIRREDHQPEKDPVGRIVHEVYCINSGLCIQRSIYQQIGLYNEKLFLDMIDYWLFDELSKHKMNRVFIVPGEIIQNFSGNSRVKILSQLRRFRIYRRDFRTYCVLEDKNFLYRERILIRRFLKILYIGITRG